ncbi:Myomodulin neuropeptides 1, partial [Stegodyphus mimosarum]
MALAKPLIAGIILAILLESQVLCDGSSSSSSSGGGGGGDKSDSIPILASGKRQHNIMRFGKRPAGGHNLIHFGKREDTSKTPQHSFLYFGKRNEDQTAIPDIIQYLQRSRDNSYKRGHTIMRFGKRDHNMMRFGKREDGEDAYDNYYPDNLPEEDKREGHSMMYFGKRDGHSMLYFGKRGPGHAILSFGKKDDGKRAHSMIHFGKREDEGDESDLLQEDKRAHSMIHFGKREFHNDNEEKRDSHSMIHFGKRIWENDDNVPYYWNPESSEKRNHNLLRFGKKTEGSRKGSHAMIHFGKRDDDSEVKRAHAMIHFGKRSVDEHLEASTERNQLQANANYSAKNLSRMKRDLSDPLVTLVHYDPASEPDAEIFPHDDDLQNSASASFYHPEGLAGTLEYPDYEQNFMAPYDEYKQLGKKDGSKNVFLRFG